VGALVNDFFCVATDHWYMVEISSHIELLT
jgi:hypothetical protein